MPDAPSASLRAVWLRNLLLLRLGGLAGGAFAYTWAILVLGFEVPFWTLCLLGAGLTVYTLDALWRWRAHASPSEAVLLREAALDLASLSVALYLTGGAHNPLVILFLLPVTVVAASLQARLIWGVTALAITCYSLLMVYHRGFPVPKYGLNGFDLHVQGMWYGFVLSAVLIALFVARMGAALRDQERALAEAREQALVESSPAGVFVLRGERLAFVNPRMAALLGYAREDLIGREGLGLVDPRDRPLVASLAERRAAGEPVPEVCECRLLTRDGQSRWVSLHNTLISFRGVPATLGSVEDIGERKRMEQELHQVSARLIEVQEEERRRVARDLHDGVCQTLTATGLIVESALGDQPAEERRASMLRLRNLVPTLWAAVDEVRRLSTDLRPVMLDDLGLLATLRWYLGELKALRPGLEVRRGLEVAEALIPDRLKTTIFRILQEAAGNAVKHSDARVLEVRLESADGWLCFSVTDDGVGFDADAPPGEPRLGRHFGLGLSSMRERAELTGGRFRLLTSPGHGTRIEVCWRLDGAPVSG